jgi:hypothetical protein
MSDEDEISEKYVCSKCIGDEYLSQQVDAAGDENQCSYCDVTGPCITIGELSDRFEVVFEQHFVRTGTEPSGFEYTMSKEFGWERPGEPTAFRIAETAQVDEVIADDVQSVLADRYADFDSAAMGEETEYDSEAQYEESPANDVEFQANWREFEKGLKSRARYFSHQADAILGMVFGGLLSLSTWQGHPVIREIGPGTSLLKLHRARVFQSDEKLKQALENPERWIGSPASEFAVAGRMNARGISTFYGASDKETAINEVRPPVGSRAVTAEFEILRPLKVLDVEILKTIYIAGSLFDPEYVGHLERKKFLGRLADRITMPIMPDDEAVDYLVTQAMAEYLAERVEPPLDGILYRSAQGGEKSFNVALFNKAARVEARTLPPGSKTSVELYEQNEDGWEENYTIWEEVPKATSPPPPSSSGPDFAAILVGSSFRDDDDREVALRLDRSTLRLQHISGVTISTSERTIFQHQTEPYSAVDDADSPF